MNGAPCLYWIHLQFCVEAISRAGGAVYCPLAAALVQVVHEYDTIAPHVAYAKIHSQRGPILMQPEER